jgi:hypothetical protein
MEIVIEPWKKLVIHEPTEYRKTDSQGVRTFMMADMSANEHLVQLSSVLKDNSKFNKS